MSPWRPNERGSTVFGAIMMMMMMMMIMNFIYPGNTNQLIIKSAGIDWQQFN